MIDSKQTRVPAEFKPNHILADNSRSRPLWLAPAALLGTFLLVFGLILWLTRQNTHNAQQHALVARTESLGESLRLRLKGNADYLVLLAQERSTGNLGAQMFQMRAAQYVKYHPELINITWVDADFFIRDVAPLAENRQILGLRLDLPEPKRVSRLAMESRQPVYTRPFEAIQGKPSFEIWVPVFQDNTFLGLLGGVYSSEKLVNLLNAPGLDSLYHLSLVDASGALLGEFPLLGAFDKNRVHSVLITSKDSGVYLRSQAYERGGQDWRLTVLELLCLALVFGMSYALWRLKLGIEERKRAQASLQEKSALLEEEIAERQSAQEALQEQAVMLEEEVTERLQAEEELLKNRAELQSILDNSPALIYMKDRAGRYLFVNRHWAELLQTTNSRVVGKTDLELFPEKTARQFMDNDRKALESEVALELVEEAPLADGMHIYHSIKVALKNSSGVRYAMCGISTDMTEHMKTEEMLRQSQKLESIGRLAGGVAHDFNNMLSVIIGCSQLAMRKVAEGDRIWQYLSQILKAAEHSSEITRQLLTFSRKEVVPPRQVNLNALILHSEKHLGRLIGEDIQRSLQLAPDLWTVLIAPSEVEQILMNLSLNSRDAMPGGGSLRIETANVQVAEDPGVSHLEAKPGDYVQLTVSDTGQGMDRETRQHIFEPFYTTKGVGKGTGLGLATVYGIIRQAGGFIKVRSEPGQGTTFQLHFPRCRGEADPEPAVCQAVPPGAGTVLFVEDDPLVREMVLQMLNEMGFKVIQADTPQEAIEICQRDGVRIDLILTDVVMPGMNGKEMVDRIESFRPNLKVIFISGYTSDLLAQRGVVGEGRYFLQKPFDMRTLNEKIMRVLTERTGADPVS